MSEGLLRRSIQFLAVPVLVVRVPDGTIIGTSTSTTGTSMYWCRYEYKVCIQEPVVQGTCFL
jgi:hypothetical protein